MVRMSANRNGLAKTCRELEGLEVVAIFFGLRGSARGFDVGCGASTTGTGESSDTERTGLISVVFPKPSSGCDSGGLIEILSVSGDSTSDRGFGVYVGLYFGGYVS